MVVVAKVLGEVAPQRGELGDQALGEGRTPALFEDGALDSLDAAIGLRPAGADEALLGSELVDRGAEAARAELAAVVGGDGLERPSGRGQIVRHAAYQRAAVNGRGIERRDVQLGPGEARCDVDGGVLPDAAARSSEPADVEAIQLYQRAGARGLQVPGLGHRRALWLRWRGVAGHQREALAARPDPVAAKDLERARPGDDPAAPQPPRQLPAGPPRAQARLAQGQRHDPPSAERP